MTDTHPYRDSFGSGKRDRGTKAFNDPRVVWVTSQDVPASRDVMQKVIKWQLKHYFPQLKENEDWRWKEGEQKIVYMNRYDATDEGEIAFKSAESGADKFQGASVDLMIHDDHDDKEVFDECDMRVMDCKGETIYNRTPIHGMNWLYDTFYVPFKNGNAVDTFVSLANMYDNHFLPLEEIHKQEAKLSEKERRMRIYGEFVSFEGLVYDMFSRNRHVVRTFIPPAHWPVYRGIDFGYNNPSACEWLAVNPETGAFFVYQEFYQNHTKTFDLAKKIFEMSRGREHIITYADSSGAQNIADLSDTRVLGDYVLSAVGGFRDKTSGRYRIMHLLETDKLFVMDNCPNLINEFERHRWLKAPREYMRNRKEEAEDKDNHGLDAIRMVLGSISPNQMKPVPKQLTPEERHWANYRREVEAFTNPREFDEHLGDIW